MDICAVIFTIILIVPLVLQLQMLILNPKKLCRIYQYYANVDDINEKKGSTPQLVQYYPKVPILHDLNSDSKITVAHLRAIFSSPVLQHKLPIRDTGSPIKAVLPTARSSSPLVTALPTAGHSSTFVKTDEALPVVDITWNYNSYRYKAFEESLRSRYGDNYPPGSVVLNSLQLNLPDSKTKVDRNVNGGLFDFAKESDTALDGPVSRKLEIEYLNPLDHFVMKQLGRPPTEERFTETAPGDLEQGLGTCNNGKRSEVAIENKIGPPGKNAGANQRSLKQIGCVEISSFTCRRSLGKCRPV